MLSNFNKSKNDKSTGINNSGDGQNNLKDKKVNSNNKTFNLILLLLAGITLTIVGSFFKGTKAANITADNNKTNKQQEVNIIETKMSYKEKVQNELVSILGKIEGVGKIEAMIYFDSGEEQVPAFNVNDSKSITKEKDTSGGERDITQENGGSTVVMSNDGGKTEPLIVKTYNPKITGICIVAEGAGDKVTELRVRQAVTNLFGLEEEKVQVYPMKN
ncbi:MAG: stage III sporulation protein AG [Clostridium argentinense]|uniref:Stage III sporulation protein AG n=1 Tax=Clostridium faecium TaxID=2762223 RepID=A0ABR8YVT7_9CLOT|nr:MULTISPECIES: stage III sporulation protein AG [Clostridium]MBD8048388.1 stage III sporulation protein AG [Clostridium faecium]MBS5823227.1 stage III sporulation protein AG [Clostridium argentinense]MDU1349021.1 stage III sporulation protein AG [Clostridium argentinense]